MSQKGVELDSEKLSCSICLDLLRDPVTVPCGHSYCMDCIKHHWDVEDWKRIYSCPQCRKTFKPRPNLDKNILLAGFLEDLKKTGLQAAAGPEDVSCDVCMKRKMKAVKSCFVCLASYCEKHLQPHYESPPFKKHKLAGPSRSLHQNICSRHHKLMEIFCRTDQLLICSLCSVEEHKGHDVVSAAAERTERQKQLELNRLDVQLRIWGRESDVALLQRELEDVNDAADKAVEENAKMFCKLNILLQRRSSEVKQRIASRQQAEVSRVGKLQEKLKQEINALQKKDAEMKQLLDSEDHTQFLQDYLRVSTVGGESSPVSIPPRIRFEKVTAAVSDVSDKIQDILENMWTQNPQRAVKKAEVLPPQLEPEPKTRAAFLEYSCDITLDPNTAHRLLVLSDEGRKATVVKQQQPYSDHPDRFTEQQQVLSREGLTGRCYWEVDVTGLGVVVAASYEKTSRAACDGEFGCSKNSWALFCFRDSCVFLHDSNKILIGRSDSTRVGVFLDHRAGLLSFYRVSERMTLLHRVQTTFTKPLHAGVRLFCGSSAEFVKLR